MSESVNNIKIICSIRFSLLITIDRFYKLFLAEDAFVNRRPDMISLTLFHSARTLSGSLRSPPSPRGEGFISGIPLPPSNLRPFGAPPSIGRRECPREPLPLEGAAERSAAGLASFFGGKAASSLPSPLGKGDRAAVDRVLSLIVDLRCISSLSFIPLSPSNLRPFGAPPSTGRRACPREPLPLEGAAERSAAGLASFFGGEAASSLPSPLGWLCQGKRYPRFFIRPTQKRPSLTSGRFYVYYLLRKTLIKSQNSISHVFSCNASSYSFLNSSLFASEYSLHCMKI